MPLGEWCEVMMDAVCSTMETACFEGLDGVRDGCMSSGVDGCLAGRDPATSVDRSYDALNRCTTTVNELECRALGSAIQQMPLEEGPLAGCAAPRSIP